MNTPLVSICCITYNHTQFIRKCLDGFLMQETTFPIEILIHDDCSTDGTTEIIREYEAKYPDLIFPLYEDENASNFDSRIKTIIALATNDWCISVELKEDKITYGICLKCNTLHTDYIYSAKKK